MEEEKKYKVTIEWRATGYYTAEVYATSEEEAIDLARDYNDGDLINQQTDYQETSVDAEADE
jgi:hypothetical protein